ncbi:uncharacterized protein Ufm1 isoform X1 [Procambarus clarkii]|uniref:uncharacterized protein Ufm1 isoform X1 n=1 Tax=Procambarus clarkii TaxID=6728 RepID=UPI001E6737D9|nr:uncharacterized protein LOC123758990 isoform X1 [Procambarus clarkii]XP_045599692.1 uncharacterized protein LOC123758990 isoform X1 [Procambarus clarkii]XP_045599693.1 uncharacterized protein LOC123758990 isoform X1 [Procambarus clarkii]XP_045599702.1 uncharacterized protein LOC123758990 isoform X1 [Procambarus clarkii]
MWKDVLHNMLYFMHDLLPAAASKATWTEDGINKAVSWAAYCERAARKFQHNDSMEIALSRLARQSQWVLKLHDLQNARQLLLELLLQNQLLDSDVKEHIQHMARTSLGPNLTTMLNEKASQQQDSYKQLLSTLRESTDNNIKRRLEMRLMLEAANSSGHEQVQNTLCKIVMEPSGISRILEVIKLDDNENCSLGPRIIDWFEGVLQSPQDSRHRSVVRGICTLPLALLCEVLRYSSNLFKLVLSTLNKEVQKLEPYYSSEGCCWMPQNPATSILSYHDLVGVYASLLQNKELAKYAHEAVCSWCLQDGGATWLDIIRDANSDIMRHSETHNG